MREPRFSVNFGVQLAWQENQGATRRVAARCVNLSSEGMRIELRDRLDPGTTLLLESNEFGRMGHALVRYCQRDKMHYLAGLRFATAFRLGDPARQKILERVMSHTVPAA